MNAKIIKVKKDYSYSGGHFFWVFFKLEDGTSARTHVYPRYHGRPVMNFERWKRVLQKFAMGQ